MGGRGTNGFTGMFTGTALEWEAGMAVAEEADDGEEVVLVPVLGSNTAPCGDSPPLCTVSAAEGTDAVVGVAAAG